MTTVLKLGGSVITDKTAARTVDHEALDTAARTIGSHCADSEGDPLVLVHGGGSFGHPAAAEHGVSESEGTHDATAVAAVHSAMGDLNDAVVSRLHGADVPALPVRPLSVAHRSNDGLRFQTGSVAAMLDEGFVPVLHGDVVVHEGKGATVLSGDEIVVALARALDADRVGLCSTVPGVLDGETVVPEIESYERVSDAVGDSDATDVTGGMAGKVKTLLNLDSPAAIFALSELDTFLDTGTAGTIVR
jgi:isopentenyl phosphate kinase